MLRPARRRYGAWVGTIRLPRHPDYLWVRVGTDTGLVGTGKTMPRVDAVERIVHQLLAPLLLGTDPSPEAFWQRAFQAVTYHGYAGAEMRAISAVDVPLWDLLGRRAGLPVHRLLGGPCRDAVDVYSRGGCLRGSRASALPCGAPSGPADGR